MQYFWDLACSNEMADGSFYAAEGVCHGNDYYFFDGAVKLTYVGQTLNAPVQIPPNSLGVTTYSNCYSTTNLIYFYLFLSAANNYIQSVVIRPSNACLSNYFSNTSMMYTSCNSNQVHTFIASS